MLLAAVYSIHGTEVAQGKEKEGGRQRKELSEGCPTPIVAYKENSKSFK